MLEGRSALLRAQGVARPATGLPPHDIGAEEAVIAALLLDEDAMDRCQIAQLGPRDFFREQNAWIYESCVSLTERGDTVTIPTVAHELDRAGRLDEAGGEPYLAELAGKYFTAAGVETHIAIVIRDSRYRKMIAAASQIAQLAYEGGPDPVRVLSHGLELLGGLLTERDTGLERLGAADLTEAAGMPWGFPALDRYTMGLVPGRLTLVAGRTKAGKSMFAAQVARNCAAAGGKVAIFTMEMANGEYERRMAHAIAAVRKRYSNYDSAYTASELAQLVKAQRQVGEWRIYSSDKSAITAQMIASGVRLANTESHVDLVVIDYLQLMGGRDSDNQAEALKAITGSLKSLATEIGCHILAVSQMNRASLSEMRAGASAKLECVVTGEKYAEPFVESMMGGAIENDADLVIMLARHTGCPGQGHMEVCIAANRNGVPGHGLVRDNFGLCRFETYTEGEVSHLAHGDMTIYHALMRDQGYYGDDGTEATAARAVGADGWIGA